MTVKYNNNFKHISDILPDEAIATLKNIDFSKLKRGSYNFSDVQFVFDADTTRRNLRSLRSNNPDSILEMGTFALHKIKGGDYYLHASEISETKLWRIMHNFGDGLISISTHNREYLDCRPLYKTFRDSWTLLWGEGDPTSEHVWRLYN